MRDLRIDVGDLTLQVREYERDGDAVILLHFGGGNLMMWERVVPRFHAHYRLILVDLRDHGKSDKPQADAHIDTMARDVIKVMAHLNLAQAHVVGSSLGAEVGLSLAARYPGKVLSLVCEGALYSEYGPYGIWEGAEAEFKDHVARYFAKVHERPDQIFPSVAALVESSKQEFESYGWWNEYVAAFQAYDAFEVRPGEFTHSWQTLAIEKYVAHYFDYRFEDYYRQLQCPVLMLPGEEEWRDARKKTIVQALSQLAPKARIVAVPGWIHPYGWLLDPEAMTQVVLEFLAEVSVR